MSHVENVENTEDAERELTAILSLSGRERYGYALHGIAGRGEAWGLRTGEGWLLVGDDAGDAFPLWPHPAFALSCAIEGWSEATPEPIALAEILDELLPSLLTDGLRLAVFPVPSGEAVVVDPRDFREHLERELESHG